MNINTMRINQACFIKPFNNPATVQKLSETFFEPEFYYLV